MQTTEKIVYRPLSRYEKDIFPILIGIKIKMLFDIAAITAST